MYHKYFEKRVIAFDQYSSTSVLSLRRSVVSVVILTINIDRVKALNTNKLTGRKLLERPCCYRQTFVYSFSIQIQRQGICIWGGLGWFALLCRHDLVLTWCEERVHVVGTLLPKLQFFKVMFFCKYRRHVGLKQTETSRLLLYSLCTISIMFQLHRLRVLILYVIGIQTGMVRNTRCAPCHVESTTR